MLKLGLLKKKISSLSSDKIGVLCTVIKMSESSVLKKGLGFGGQRV
jgi:hypothetical protein